MVAAAGLDSHPAVQRMLRLVATILCQYPAAWLNFCQAGLADSCRVAGTRSRAPVIPCA